MAAATTNHVNNVASWQISSQLLAAIQCRNASQCTALLANGVDADQEFKISSVTKPAICFATERGAIEIVELLINCGSSVNRRDTNGNSPLHIAVDMGYQHIAQLLLEHRANVNGIDNYLACPLHLAAKRGDLNIAKLLISFGADVCRKDESDRTPLGCACASPKLSHEMVELLLQHGSNAKEVDGLGLSLLGSVLSSPNYEYGTVKTLIENGARPDWLICGQRAPIHLVILSRNGSMKWQCLDLMLKAGCDVDLQTREKQTALHLAVIKNDLTAVRILLRANAKPNTIDRLGMSPLAQAISASRCVNEMIKLLLGAGARIPSEDLNLTRLRDFRNQLDKEDLTARLMTPNRLTELARKAFCKRFGPSTYDWLSQNGKSEIPASLIPFAKYEAND